MSLFARAAGVGRGRGKKDAPSVVRLTAGVIAWRPPIGKPGGLPGAKPVRQRKCFVPRLSLPQFSTMDRQPACGSKPGIDATKKLPGAGFKRPWPPLIKMDAAVKAKVEKLFGS